MKNKLSSSHKENQNLTHICTMARSHSTCGHAVLAGILAQHPCLIQQQCCACMANTQCPTIAQHSARLALASDGQECVLVRATPHAHAWPRSTTHELPCSTHHAHLALAQPLLPSPMPHAHKASHVIAACHRCVYNRSKTDLIT